MTYRTTVFSTVFTVLVLILFTSCDIFESGGSKNHQLRLNLNASEANLEGSGGNTIQVDNIKISLSEFTLRTLSARFLPDQDSIIIDTVAYAEFSDTFPSVLSFAPSENGKKVNLGELELGMYRSSLLTLQPPTGEASDPDLGSDNSIMIEGSFNGNSFSYIAGPDSALQLFKDITPSLEMTEQTATLELDFTVNTETLFRKSSGVLRDPTSSTVQDTLPFLFYQSIGLAEGNRSLRRYQEMQPR